MFFLLQRKGGCLGFLKEFFDTKLVLETLSVVIKKGPRNRRKRVVFLLIGVFIVFGPMVGM